MAKLYFYYSAMNAGKTTSLLQSSYNYNERGMSTIMMKPLMDQRESYNTIRSRIGLEGNAILFDQNTDLYETVAKDDFMCAFVDEAQFLTKAQVLQLCRIVDELSKPVLAYGLRTDFRGELFEGSQYLLAWADKLYELKTICHCGAKATMNVRTDERCKVMLDGEQIQVGGNEMYISLCRKHYNEAINGGKKSMVKIA